MTDEKEIQESEMETPVPTEKSGQKIPWFRIMGVGTVVLLAAAGIFFWKGAKEWKSGENSLSLPGRVVFPVPGKKELRFDDFLIPLPADPAHTGISFSVVIRYRDSEWSTMTDPEKTWLRAVIYDTLVKEMQKQKKPPSLETMVSWVNRAVRERFSNRPFEEVMVDNVFML
jgi:flagellar basal body-associated protein FliL